MTQQASHDTWAVQANALQAQLNEARARLLEVEATGTAGPVTVVLGATGNLRDVRFAGGPVF